MLQSDGIALKDHGVDSVKAWDTWLQTGSIVKSVHFTENSALDSLPYRGQRLMTMVRNPIHHVLSQYNHCTVSKGRPQWRNDRMPSPIEWLSKWKDAMSLEQKDQQRLENTFSCYNPINLQSTRLGRTSAGPYDVIGLTERHFESTCLFAMTLGVVPNRCNCTSTNDTIYEGYPRVDHGVTRHGASMRITENETRLIQTLTDKDRSLYDEVQRNFETTIQRMEKVLNIVMCRPPLSRSSPAAIVLP